MKKRIGIVGFGGHSIAHPIPIMPRLKANPPVVNDPKYDEIIAEYWLIQKKLSKLPSKKRQEITETINSLVRRGAITLLPETI